MLNGILLNKARFMQLHGILSSYLLLSFKSEHEVYLAYFSWLKIRRNLD